MKKLAFIALIVSNIFALEFGQLGNTPESVGGAGVAYKKNAWAVYYNPALLGANRKASIAYSFGFGYADSNVLELASIDINALKNIKDEVNGLTKTATVTTRKIQGRNGGGQTRANGTSWNFTDLGLLGNVLGQLTNKTTGGNDSDLKDYLCGKLKNGGAGGTCNSLNDAVTEMKKPENADKLTTIKKDLQDAIGKTPTTDSSQKTALGILGSIIENLDPNDIPNLVEGVKNGSANLKDIIDKIGGGIKISKGTSPALDSLFTIVDTINKNGLNISSNNGIAWHIKGSKNRGAIGMGLIANVYGFAGVELDSTHKKIIIDGSNGNGVGGGGVGGNYFEVGTDGDKITISGSDDTKFNNSSVLSKNANHKLHANGLLIAEIPVAYGHTIALPIGDLHLGATLKYIFATSMDNSQKFDFDNLKIDFGNISNNLRYTHTFGIDLGVLYTMKWLGVGLVAKNLNAPQINTANGKYRILPQVRAGFSAEVWKLTFLLDMDLTPNKTLEPNKFNQMVGGGVILDLNWVDFRFGVMGDMHKNPYGPIFTMGMNIVHFLDFSLQTSAKLVDLGQYTNGVRMPNYFKLSLGGRFQW